MKDVTIMPPYVAEEHRELLANAEKNLEEFSSYLLEKIKKDMFCHGPNLDPHPSEIRAAERAFIDNPVRQQLIRSLGEIKMLVERPRFLVTNFKP